MTEKGIYTTKQVMDNANEMFEGLLLKKLYKLEKGIIGDTAKINNYDNMIVEPFESSSKSEVEKNSEEILKVFEQYPDLKDIAKVKLDVLIQENTDDEERVAILNDFKDNLFPVAEKNI